MKLYKLVQFYRIVSIDALLLGCFSILKYSKLSNVVIAHY